MALWQGKSKRKVTGGRRRYARGKRKFEIGSEQQFAIIGESSRKYYTVRGGNPKIRILQEQYANVVDPKSGKVANVPIKTVLSNPANHNYIQRNILTKGATIET